MVPRRLRAVLERGGGTLVIDLSGPDIVVRRHSGRSAREIGRVERVPSDAGAEAAAVSRLLRRVRRRRLDVVLRLPADDALRKVLHFPVAAEENLRQVLSFEMDRQTPFKAEQVYFDFRVRHRDTKAGRIEVELVTVPRGVVDEAVQRAASWGRVPDVVDIDQEKSRPRWAFNLLPDEGPEANTRRRLVNAGLALLAVSLLAATVYVPLERERNAAEAVADAANKARIDADAAIRLRQEVDRLVKESGFLAKSKRESVKTVEILDELTRLLPDDTWLQRFHISEEGVRIYGYSPAASRLVGLIEKSPKFDTVRFRSPVTQDPREGAERFDLSMTISGSRKK